MGWFKNIVTFGSSGRIERKIEEYEDSCEDYKREYSKFKSKEKELEEVFNLLIQEKVESLKTLKKITSISKNLKSKERELESSLGIDFLNININISNIETTISFGDMALNATKGTASGIGTALGSWALVSSFGTASTGAAISGLSGAAATNATLAWFGGGTVAAGGGGMALGSLVVGGLVVVPALVLTGIFSHLKANKEIKEIEKKIYEVEVATANLRENILKIEMTEKRANEITDTLVKTREIFEKELKKTYRKIYPIPYISAGMKKIRQKIFKKNYFSENDLKEIQYILEFASNFSKILDSKII